MSANPNPDHHEKRDADKAQMELEHFKRLQIAADDQIERISKAYERLACQIKWAMAIAGVLAAIFAYFFLHDMWDLKTHVHEDVQDSISSMTSKLDWESLNLTNTINAELTNMTKTVEDKITEATNRLNTAIEDGLNKQNVQATVAEVVSNRVDLIVAREVSNGIARMTNQPLLLSNNFNVLGGVHIGKTIDFESSSEYASFGNFSNTGVAYFSYFRAGSEEPSAQGPLSLLVYGNGTGVNYDGTYAELVGQGSNILDWDSSGIQGIVLATNSKGPLNSKIVRAWVTVSNSGAVFKLPLYQ